MSPHGENTENVTNEAKFDDNAITIQNQEPIGVAASLGVDFGLDRGQKYLGVSRDHAQITKRTHRHAVPVVRPPRSSLANYETNPPTGRAGCAAAAIVTRKLQNEPTGRLCRLCGRLDRHTQITKRTHRHAVPVVRPPRSSRANYKTDPPARGTGRVADSIVTRKLQNEPTGTRYGLCGRLDRHAEITKRTHPQSEIDTNKAKFCEDAIIIQNKDPVGVAANSGVDFGLDRREEQPGRAEFFSAATETRSS